MTQDSARPLRAFADVDLGRQRSPERAEGPFMVPYLRAANVKDGFLDLTDVKKMDFTPAEQQLFSLRPGDVLVSEGAGSLVAVGASAVWDGSIPGVVCYQNSLLRLRPRPSVASSRFLAWWARHAYSSSLFAGTAMGANIYHLGAERLRAIPVQFPSIDVQEKAAAFLDRETARIDALIQAKRRILAALQERWRTEVVEVVTCGLTREDLVPLDSSWFPRAPASWRLEPLKRRWTVIDCKHRTPAYVDEGHPLVSHGEIEDGLVYPGRSGHFVGEADYLDLIEGRPPKAGDIVYTRNASIGNAGYVDTEEQFAMGQDVCLITSKDQDQRFLTYFLNFVAKDQLVAQRLGATFGRINVAQIVELKILCPPAKDQRAIADHLDRRRIAHEKLVRRLARQMDLLAEHRRALISTAVMGQLIIPA